MTWKRVATAAVLIPFVIVIVLLTNTAVVAISTAAVTILALREYFALGDAIGHRAYRLWTMFCALLLCASQWLAARSQELFAPFGPLRNAYTIYFPLVLESPVTVFFIFLLGMTMLTLWTRRPLVESLPAAGISSSALLLVAFPLSFAVRLHGIPLEGRYLLLFALLITWAADTTAYFVGRSFGRHLLAPHISPKKTWEGAAGSMAGSLLVAFLFHAWLTRQSVLAGSAFPVLNISLFQLLCMAVVGNIAGQLGDLLESAYKRSAGVKDSGGLLPGHGGVLDRIDALILCIPVVWYYLYASAVSGGTLGQLRW
jgi:phosphatidate cytidylyltransferase